MRAVVYHNPLDAWSGYNPVHDVLLVIKVSKNDRLNFQRNYSAFALV